MFDVWYGDVELTTLTLIMGIVLLLPIQLLLCFKVKSRTIRLLPVIILSVLVVTFIVMCLANPGWDGLVYIFLAIFAGIMMFMSGIGWAIWAIVKKIKK
ncbi:MAG: hypothetical protein IJ324_09125 [Lachnospiraceae bacterium]|nr:hypothetical protein [Lachnospiraceae bacterium]